MEVLIEIIDGLVGQVYEVGVTRLVTGTMVSCKNHQVCANPRRLLVSLAGIPNSLANEG